MDIKSDFSHEDHACTRQSLEGTIYEDVRLGERPENWHQPLLGPTLALTYFQTIRNSLSARTLKAHNAFLASPKDLRLKKAYRNARLEEEAFTKLHAADIEWEIKAGYRMDGPV